MRLRDPKVLKGLMDAKGVTLTRLGREAGYTSHAYISQLLAGKVQNLKVEPAEKIAVFLQVPFDLLFEHHAASKTARPARKSRTAA